MTLNTISEPVERFIVGSARRFSHGDPVRAEDLEQDGRVGVLLSCQRAERAGLPQPADGLLCHAARCAMLDVIRKDIRRAVYDGGPLDGDGEAAHSADLDLEQDLRIVLETVDALPEAERCALLLGAQGMSATEIGHELQISHHAAGRLVRRARTTINRGRAA